MKRIISAGLPLFFVLWSTMAYAHRSGSAGNEADYVYYKLRDMEERLEKLELRVSKLNKIIQSADFKTEKQEKYVVQPKVRYDDDPVEESLQIEILPVNSDDVIEGSAENAKNAKSSPIRVERNNDSPLDSRIAEREFYDDAFSALRENRTGRAEKLFLEFVKKFPDSGLTSNAHYWLGEIYYAQAKYKDASSHFLSAYQLKPTGSKAPDSVLKMALALEKLGNTSGACATLIKLINEFPNIHQETKRHANIEISKLRCDNN